MNTTVDGRHVMSTMTAENDSGTDTQVGQYIYSTCRDASSCCFRILPSSEPPSFETSRYSATLNNMNLVYRPLMGGLLHLVQRGTNGQCTDHRIAERCSAVSVCPLKS